MKSKSSARSRRCSDIRRCLAQCFSNLVGNAIKFVAPGVQPPIRIWAEPRDAKVRINVQDIYANRTQYPTPGLVLLDLDMPPFTGFQVLEWLQRHPGAPKVLVVVLTASSNPADIARARFLGAADYRVKPTNSAHLVPVFRELQARWLTPEQVSTG